MTQGLSRAAVREIACGAFIVLLSFGIRSSFGLFLQPMSMDLGWGREVFALAMAIQNLLWGLGQPFVGAIADKWGTARTILGGAVDCAVREAAVAWRRLPFPHRVRRLHAR